ARSRRSLLRPASYNLKRAPGFGNFLLGRSAEGVRVNRPLGLELAIAQDLDGVRGTTDEAMRTKQFGRHRLSRRENVKLFHVHHRIGHAKQVMEATLRRAPVQRHLAAFKAAAARIAAG